MSASVRVHGLGKRYRVGEHARSVRDVAAEWSSAPSRLIGERRRREQRTKDVIWAIRDVSFELQPDEIVGVIGRNGAGKSTLLKVLSRITEPTEGYAELRGRVCSLLEVGTGFHPDLTGRENVYMNGAILGMTRAEINRRFDEIVAFADVERFIETPVKRYSSGMQVRLAFSVAAHFDSDIMMVDELLAVGDAEFQRKCLGRMEKMGSAGRTVVFVSHSMPSIQRLCPRVILLDGGRVIADGKAREVVATYLDTGLGTSAAREWGSPNRAPGDDVARLKAVRVMSAGRIAEDVDIHAPIDIEVEYWYLSTDSRIGPTANLHFYNEEGICLFVTSDQSDQEDRQWHGRISDPGVVKAVCHIPGNMLAEGSIYVHAVVSDLNPTRIHALERDAVAFHVVDHTTGEGVRGEYASDWPGVMRPALEWTVDVVPAKPRAPKPTT